MRKLDLTRKARKMLAEALRPAFARVSKAVNEAVRKTQKLQPGKCSVCGTEGIAFMCEGCGRTFCTMHAYNTFGFCQDCDIFQPANTA